MVKCSSKFYRGECVGDMTINNMRQYKFVNCQMFRNGIPFWMTIVCKVANQ